MNKTIKLLTILVVVLSAVTSLFLPSIASASGQASFSSAGMFLVGNHAYAGTQNWTSSLSNMQPGDQVAFKFTFLNTSSVTAIDAKNSFSATASGNCITVTGTIWAQNVSPISQSVSICGATGYTISLSQMSASFGGVGDVAPGYGGIEYYATGLYSITGQAVQQNPTANLWAEYPDGTRVTQVQLGVAPYLHWTSTNASECHVLAGAGFSTGGATSGEDQVSALAGTTTFSIQCTNGTGGSVQANYTVSTTNPPQQPTVNIYANPSSVNSGGSSVLNWSSTNATECHSTSGNFSTGNSPSGSVSTGALYSTSVFSISCSNASASAQSSVTVNVNTINPPQQPTVNIYANPMSVSSGGQSTIQWTSSNASQCSGSGFSTGGATSGSVLSSPLTSATTFSITCSNSSGGSASASVTVSVTSNPQGNAPVAQTNSATNISQNSAQLNGSVDPNQSLTNYWFEYGTSQSLGNTTASQIAGAGDAAITVNSLVSGLSSNTTYYFRIDAQNSYGTTQGSILSFTTSNGGTNGIAPTVTTGGSSSISQNSAQISGYVDPNGYQSLYWFEYGTSQSLGNSTGFQSAGAGTDALPYNTTLTGLMPSTTYYYRIDAQNSYGTTQGSILSFTTSGGGSNCIAPSVQTYSASNTYQNSAQLNGSVNPNNCQTNYWFEYGTNYSLGNTTGFQSAGASSGSFNVSSYISSLSYNQTYYFRIDAQNSAGTSYGTILSFTTYNNNQCISGNCNNNGSQPYVQTLSATNYGYGNSGAVFNGSVNSNSNYGDSVYGWFNYGTNPNSLNLTTNSTYVGSGNYQQNFSQNVYNLMSGATYYYQAVARNSYGTGYGQVLSFTTGGNNNNGSAPQVTTNSATYVYRNSSLLNGQVDANGSISNAWFEYGTTQNLGSQTNSQPMGAGTDYQNYSSALTGLSANTTYYFRAVAQNSYGTNYGSILSFTTGGGSTVITVPTQPTVIVRTVNNNTGGGLSCVVLVPSLNVSQLTPGQNFTLTVTYRNGCNYNLSNVFLKVILPSGTDFVSTNYPFFNRDANGISYNLGALPVNFQSAISIEGIVGSSIVPGNSVIFSAVVNYNDPQGRFQSISSYLTAVVGSGQALGATVLDAFGNLLGNWLFDLLLIALIIFLIYWIFFKKRDDRVLIAREEDVLEAKPLKTS